MMYFFTMLNLHVNVFQHAILSYAVFLDANSFGAVVEFVHLLCEINDSVFSMYHIDQQLCFYTEYIFKRPLQIESRLLYRKIAMLQTSLFSHYIYGDR